MTATSTQGSKQRAERRIAVRLPMQVTGRDARGMLFTEETSSENLCRNGAAFVTRFEVMLGGDLDIRIPMSHQAWRRAEADFATKGKVVHIGPGSTQGEILVGVQFTGPRFQKVFRSESAA